ncbi:MAG: hypothetical protein SFY96_03290 [Planctomycetota bacterium]|nr:hypothetical protein [Planctomycetota bacterium]
MTSESTIVWVRRAAKLAGICLATLAALFPAGCSTPSISAAYTEATLERPSRIEGVWTQVPDAPDADGKAKPAEFALSVSQGKDGLYNVELRFLKPQKDEPAVQHLLVGFTRINDTLFADAVADFDREPTLAAYREYLITAHIFSRVSLDGDELTVTPMKSSGINSLVANTPDAISHAESEGKRYVLTAETPRIREFLASRTKDEEFFSGGVKFRRDAN